jgi:hypothetical protein
MNFCLYKNRTESKALKLSKAAAMAAAISGCGAQTVSEPPITVVYVPTVPEKDYPDGQAPAQKPAQTESMIPKSISTETTLLLNGTIFLAFVSIDEGGSLRDLESAKVDFHYSAPDSVWMPIPECRKVSECDVSALIGRHPFGIGIKAEFSSAGYSFSSARYYIEPALPAFSTP